jgi:hypothetical protein
MCLGDHRLTGADKTQINLAWKTIESHFASAYAGLRQRIKDVYGPLDPDSDDRTLESARSDQRPSEGLGPLLEKLLQRANYEKLTASAVEQMLANASLFDVKVHVDFNDFEEVLLYYRGATPTRETIKRWFGLQKLPVEFRLLERVVVFIRFKADIEVDSTLGGYRPGSTMLKLFQNVPDADTEMVFPNTQVMMRSLDKWMIGVPALITGGLTVSTKLGAMLVLLGSMLGFWLGFSSEPVHIGRAELLILLAGIVTLLLYFWKQFSSFRKRKFRYREALTRNLYFKLLDNNAGVLLRLLDEAEDADCKESLLAYSFLVQAGEPLTPEALDIRIEEWLATDWQCRVDFDIRDALGKLRGLGLVLEEAGQWTIDHDAATPPSAD